MAPRASTKPQQEDPAPDQITDPTFIQNGTIVHVKLQGFIFENCKIIAAVLDDCTITNSTLEDCALLTCIVNGCEIDKSELRDTKTDLSTIIRDSDVLRCASRDTQFNTCTVQKSTIRRSNVVDCQITHCVEVRTSKVSGGICNEVKFSNCELDNVTVRHSTLLETEVTDCIGYKCTFTTRPLALRKFPAELRSNIFTRVLAKDAENWRWGGETPALIVALRGDPEIYREALDVLYKYQSLNVFHNPIWIPASVYQNVHKLVILSGSPNVTNPPRQLLVRSSVREILVVCSDTLQPFIDISTNWLNRLKTVEMISFEADNLPKPEPKPKSKAKALAKPPSAMKDVVKFVNAGLGVTGKMQGKKVYPEWHVGVWKAQKGTTLRWKAQ